MHSCSSMYCSLSWFDPLLIQVLLNLFYLRMVCTYSHSSFAHSERFLRNGEFLWTLNSCGHHGNNKCCQCRGCVGKAPVQCQSQVRLGLCLVCVRSGLCWVCVGFVLGLCQVCVRFVLGLCQVLLGLCQVCVRFVLGLSQVRFGLGQGQRIGMNHSK